MKRLSLYIMLLSFMLPAQAVTWVFESPQNVSGESTEGIFAHLESAGRKSIAVSAGWVAVAWEDNRDGAPACYVALKAPSQNVFSTPVKISGREEAAEPAIVGLENGKFAVGWEEGGRVFIRIVSEKSLGDALVIAHGEAGQISLATDGQDSLSAVWSQFGANIWQIYFAKFEVKQGNLLKELESTAVEAKAKGDQAYPSVAMLGDNTVIVAWEDRSAGHTRMMTAVSRSGGNKFQLPRELNEYVWRGKDFGFGMGTGAMRVALSATGKEGAIAVWSDKRDFPSGYDVYAAVTKQPLLKFGANEKVQDEFGNNIAQWHPAVAANARGIIAAVWDDDRDGTPDIWLSWRENGVWAENLVVPGASGAGVQSDPAVVIDEDDNLHLAWIEKLNLNAPSVVRYVRARVIK